MLGQKHSKSKRQKSILTVEILDNIVEALVLANLLDNDTGAVCRSWISAPAETEIVVDTH